MRKAIALVALLSTGLWLGCSTTIVAQRPLATPVEGAPRIGEGCWRTDECDHGTCQSGHCVGSDSRAPTVLEEIDGALQGRSAQVLLAGDPPPESVEAREVTVAADKTRWLELQHPAGASRPRSVPTDALRSISVVGRGRGAAEGLGLGILAGAATGAIWGAVVGPRTRFCTGDLRPGEQCSAIGAGLGSFLGAIAGAIVGAPIGLLSGAFIGHRTTIEFESSRPPP